MTLAATEAKPRMSPAAAAATIVQRDREGRGGSAASSGLVTNGASLRGARLEGAWLGGGSESLTTGTELASATSTWGAGGVGVGMARKVIFSFALGTAGSLAGGGGGTLERSTGMCSDTGASPPRTTTACRGGDFSPGRAMKPPRGVSASADTGADSSRFSSSCE